MINKVDVNENNIIEAIIAINNIIDILNLNSNNEFTTDKELAHVYKNLHDKYKKHRDLSQVILKKSD